MTTRTRRILIADDEPHIGRIIQLRLEDRPYEVIIVKDGRAALEFLEKNEPIDLVLLDIMMPYLSGLDVLAALKQLPHRGGTPAIILTARGVETDRDRAISLGAVDFFTKPFSLNKLRARIDEIFA
ncbi:MAG: response regulator [Gemmatimonadota bacterium]|nr:response regulator [Gemmatimonadota bacterium]